MRIYTYDSFMDIQVEEMRDRRLHPVMALVKNIVSTYDVGD